MEEQHNLGGFSMRIFKCEPCCKLFWYSEQLKEHLQSHLKEEKFQGNSHISYVVYDLKVNNKWGMKYKRKLTYEEKQSIKKFNKEWVKK